MRLLPVEALEPAAFFVVDRSVYRPGQALRFAAFLRRQDHVGRFVPVDPQDVEVRLTSVQKRTVAAKLRLRSDAAGRLTGEYTFSEADALDSYELSAVGFKGAATVALAEFRKSKIKLNIAGKRTDQKLDLSFDTVDFAGKSVPASRVDFTVQVVRNLPPKPVADALKAEHSPTHPPRTTRKTRTNCTPRWTTQDCWAPSSPPACTTPAGGGRPSWPTSATAWSWPGEGRLITASISRRIGSTADAACWSRAW